MYCSVKKRIAKPKDILFSVRAPVGRINITMNEIIIGRGLAAIRSKIDHQSLQYYQLKQSFYKDDIMGGGTIFASITKQDIYDIKLLTPTAELVLLFQNISEPIDQQIETLFKMNSQLKQARDLLLPRLMNGEISV